VLGGAMSAKEREMVSVLSRENRMDRLQTVISLIRPDVSLILDLGCGIGVLTSLLAKGFPLASIVGIDSSNYLLQELRSKRMKPNIFVVQGDAPIFPLKPESFDLVIAVQVLHEILHFKGKQELVATIDSVYDLLQEGGDFIVLDHRNPGNAAISVRLSTELLEKLNYFKQSFKPRKISYEIADKEWVKTSMRDFYDFVTKIWAIGTGMEEEEMCETHTPFTEQEFTRLCERVGFKINHVTSLTPIVSYLRHYRIDVKTELRLPNRHFIVAAKK
jgi:ubiquinone/menaquinone biosynthesis C-methylase UbiE